MLVCLASGICQQGPGIGPMDSGPSREHQPRTASRVGSMEEWETGAGSGSRLGPSGLEAKT